MSEFDREEILAQRMEEVQKIKDKRAISQMVNAQRSELDGVAKAAKRAWFYYNLDTNIDGMLLLP